MTAVAPARRPSGSSLATFRDMAGFLFGATSMFAAMYETQAILPTLGRAFHVSPSEAGLTVSLVVFSVMAGAWIWGPVSDRIGRRRSLVLASWLLAAPTLAGAFAPNFETLLACRVLQGLCMPGLLIVGVPFVIETYAPRHGTRVMGYYIASLVTGGLVGRVGVALITSVSSWRAGIAVLTVLPVTAALVLGRSLPPDTAPARSGRGGARALRAMLRNPVLLSASFTGAGGFFAFTATYTYVGYRLEGPPFHLGPTLTGLVFLLWVLGGLGPTMGRLAEGHGWRKVAAAAMCLGVCGIVLTLTHVLVLVIVGLGIVIFTAFTVQTAASVGQGTSTTADKGLASAVYFTVYYAAGSIAGYAPGLAWESFGWIGVASSALGSYAVGLVATVGGALLLRHLAGRRRAAVADNRLDARRPDSEESA